MGNDFNNGIDYEDYQENNYNENHKEDRIEDGIEGTEEKGIRQVVWGLILALFDFRINGIDLLPDFIGYILVFLGLGKLMSLSINFGKAQKFAIFLAILSFASIYEAPNTNFLAFQSTSLSTLFMLLGSVTVIIKLFMVYFICQGMLELIEGIEEESTNRFTDLIKGRWKTYLFINGAFQVLTPFALNVSEQAMLVVMLIGVPILLIMEILLIHLIHRFGKEVVS